MGRIEKSRPEALQPPPAGPSSGTSPGPSSWPPPLGEEAPPHPTLELHSPDAAEVERVWLSYWAPLLRDGGLARLKGELYDAWWLVGQVRQVYAWATGGLCSDPCASAAGIIAEGERVRAELVQADRARRVPGGGDGWPGER
jgi:hypothetical protein